MAFLASFAPLARRLHTPELGRKLALELADAAASECKAGPVPVPVFLVREISEHRLSPAEEVDTVVHARLHLQKAVQCCYSADRICCRRYDDCAHTAPVFARVSLDLMGPFRGLAILRVSKKP